MYCLTAVVVRSAGWAVMTGAMVVEVTVKLTLFDVVVPVLLVITTWIAAPLSERLAVGITRLVAVAPGMFTPLRCH